MSTNNKCLIVETEPGQWFYVLEDYNAPKNAWDWREYARAYGPFDTEEVALKHLFDNHANPGGHNSSRYVEGFEPDETLTGLINEAEAPRARRGVWR